MDMLWGVQDMVSLIHSLGTQVKQNIIIISNDVVALQQAKPLGTTRKGVERTGKCQNTHRPKGNKQTVQPP